MALKPVSKAPKPSEVNQLKREYRALERKFEDAKYRFMDSISWEDFETLNLDDFLELKELYILKKNLYWKIHQLEHPEDKATEKAYRYLNSMNHNDSTDFLMKLGLTTHQLIHEIEKNPNFLNEVTA